MQTLQLTRLFVFLGLFLPGHAYADNDISAGLTFVTIPAGLFTMGSTDISEAIADLPDREAVAIDDEPPAHNMQLIHLNLAILH